jgi:hypothetical protein
MQSQLLEPPTLREHLHEVHPQQIADTEDSELSAIISVAEKVVPIPPGDIKCPLCFQSNWASRRSFATHVGRHLEGIALAVLPDQEDSHSDTEWPSDEESDVPK